MDLITPVGGKYFNVSIYHFEKNSYEIEEHLLSMQEHVQRQNSQYEILKRKKIMENEK